MDRFKTKSVEELLRGNPYPGRGIIVGKSENGKSAVSAYFIMGRSENSRNRIFIKKDGVLLTHPFDKAKISDPTLIIYPAIKSLGENLIITNGDHTDTIYNGLKNNIPFEKSLEERCFEPDAPNFTPRISSLLVLSDNDFSYKMSILKSRDADGTVCERNFYTFRSVCGIGHLIHTYETNGNPIPPFKGEPRQVYIPDDIDELAEAIWCALDNDNKISLYVRYTDIISGEYTDRIINKYN